MPFHPPNEAEIRSCREQAKRHQQAAQRSGRAQVQAELPRGQRVSRHRKLSQRRHQK